MYDLEADAPGMLVYDVLSRLCNRNVEPPNYFDIMPTEMILEIAKHLDGITLLTLASMNGRLFDILAPICRKSIAILDVTRYGELQEGRYIINPGTPIR